MSEKPLHVRVAEALGQDLAREHKWDKAPEGYRGCVLCGATASWQEDYREPCVTEYDIDWSATGPLIERFGIRLYPGWAAGISDGQPSGWYDTPLLAVCHLILALHAAGKLPALSRR